LWPVSNFFENPTWRMAVILNLQKLLCHAVPFGAAQICSRSFSFSSDRFAPPNTCHLRSLCRSQNFTPAVCVIKFSTNSWNKFNERHIEIKISVCKYFSNIVRFNRIMKNNGDQIGPVHMLWLS